MEALAEEVVLKETDIYVELPPPAALRGSIACLWLRRGDGSDVRILPDACVDLVWREESGAMLAGPDTGPALARTEPGRAIAGVRFLPGAGGPALGLPLDELSDRRVPVEDLGLDPDGRLSADLDPWDALCLLTAAATRLATAAGPDRAVQQAALRLLDPRQRVESLAGDLGLSERQLRRRVRAGVGYGPKTLQRVLRLRRFLWGGGDLGRAALDAGYSDQAHLTRECTRLTGLSPAQLRAANGLARQAARARGRSS
jgi:AraC-like DNA-binding protein